jgi:predicted O-linked N-acetylglucosamine transferase (SPINDLY family)
VPPGADLGYSEAVIRLPHSYVAFEPPAEPPPLDRPDLARDTFTFGSFNALKKITPEVVSVWSRILRAVPDSRMLLKAHALSCEATRHRYAALFAAQAIPFERLRFVGATSAEEHLAWMRRASIALDSFPYAGGRTTLEAMWMGLPVVALHGATFASCHSLSYLTSAGLRELAASDVDAYVDLAVALVGDPERLADLRSGMRARMLRSPLCDIEHYADDLAQSLVTIWRRWCAGLPAESFDIGHHDQV